MKRNSRDALIANRYANLRSQKETPSGILSAAQKMIFR